MFGLGDEAPAPDTVALMEDILVEYLHEMVGIIFSATWFLFLNDNSL